MFRVGFISRRDLLKATKPENAKNMRCHILNAESSKAALSIHSSLSSLGLGRNEAILSGAAPSKHTQVVCDAWEIRTKKANVCEQTLFLVKTKTLKFTYFCATWKHDLKSFLFHYLQLFDLHASFLFFTTAAAGVHLEVDGGKDHKGVDIEATREPRRIH